MGRKIIVTAALAGAATRKEQNPNVPYSPAEFIAEAKRVEAAGGAMVHIHCRDADGWQTQNPEVVKEVIAGIQANTKLLVNLSTGSGGPGFPQEARKMPIQVAPCEVASLDPGTMNFVMANHTTGDIMFDMAFENPFTLSIELGEIMKARGIKPELECFDLGHLHNVLWLQQHHDFLPAPLHFSMVFGVLGGMRFDLNGLNAFVAALPPGSTWQGIGVGPSCFPVAMASAVFGGHIRVGLEDNIFIDQTTKTLAKGSYEQVEKVVKMIKLLGHEPATPEEARGILGLRS
jgi:3-keto-5-aminohexanoate cleavage enzyme